MGNENESLAVKSPEQIDREKLWEKLDTKYYKKGVEDGIREVVVGLNIMGFSTTFSCEGHSKGSRLYERSDGTLYQRWKSPYVDLFMGAGKFEDNPKATKLQQIIDEFYEGREVDSKYKIVLSPHGTYYTQVSSGNVNITDVSRGKEQFLEGSLAATKWLRRQKTEMRAFGSFLKEKYLETGYRV